MKPSADTEILRDVALHAQPVALVRPRASVTQLRGPREPLPAKASSAVADAVTEGMRCGYAEGLERGREEGRRAGMAEGLLDAQKRVEEAVRSAREAASIETAARDEEARATLEAIVGRLDNFHREFEAAAARRLDSLEADAIALAFEAVCRIVGEGDDRADRVTGAVRAAMRPLRTGALLRVRVHPEDLRLLGATAAGQALMSHAGPVEWIGDAGVDSGGCILDTRRGSIDARMEVQLARLRNLWAEVARSAAATPVPARVMP